MMSNGEDAAHASDARRTVEIQASAPMSTTKGHTIGITRYMYVTYIL